nr:MAG TPA: hypothetical protein [Caudoviricetes sp.]
MSLFKYSGRFISSAMMHLLIFLSILYSKIRKSQ